MQNKQKYRVWITFRKLSMLIYTSESRHWRMFVLKVYELKQFSKHFKTNARSCLILNSSANFLDGKRETKHRV